MSVSTIMMHCLLHALHALLAPVLEKPLTSTLSKVIYLSESFYVTVTIVLGFREETFKNTARTYQGASCCVGCLTNSENISIGNNILTG